MIFATEEELETALTTPVATGRAFRRTVTVSSAATPRILPTSK
jgi:hypothetical protein